MNKTPKRSIKGVVVSDKMDKTVIVQTDTYKQHPKYKKRYKITKKYFAHNLGNKAKTGDNVVIEEIRPMSRNKRWTVKTISISHAQANIEQDDDKESKE